MGRIIFILIAAISTFSIHQCERRKMMVDIEPITIQELPYRPNTTVIIDTIIDLHNQKFSIPEGIVLDFREGGKFINGQLYGNNTRIIPTHKAIFRNIHIRGKWVVPVIYGTMLEDVCDNHLKDLFSLCSESTTNKVYIESGKYYVVCPSNGSSCITIPGRTDLQLDGTIEMRPNPFKAYTILHLNGSDIRLHGTGGVKGDKFKHLDDKGEWGHGIYIGKGKRNFIDSLTFADCWGDCIYIRGEDSEIEIKNCRLINGRRQGISITQASYVLIDSLHIEGVSGTPPSYAIDIEPNEKDVVDKIVIRNTDILRCKGGIKSSAMAVDSEIKSIVIENCEVKDKCEKNAFEFIKSNSVEIRNCYAEAGNSPMLFRSIRQGYLINNVISGIMNNYVQSQSSITTN